MEYADEPRLVFTPLTEEEYCAFYFLEMDAFKDDAPFYLSHLNNNDRVLELGCGCGRLTRLVSHSCRKVVGIDISAEMIRRAKLLPGDSISYQRMDMLNFSFAEQFDTIIIGYNTLNLLGDKSTILHCLRLCRRHLAVGGKLLAQLYHPDTKIMDAEGERFFQFGIHTTENGDKVIKETLKSFDRRTHLLKLEERYRVRPRNPAETNRDLRYIHSLYAPDIKEWLSLFTAAGFTEHNCSGDFQGNPFIPGENSLLLIKTIAQE